MVPLQRRFGQCQLPNNLCRHTLKYHVEYPASYYLTVGTDTDNVNVQSQRSYRSPILRTMQPIIKHH